MGESDEDTESFDNRTTSPFLIQKNSSLSVGQPEEIRIKIRKNSVE